MPGPYGVERLPENGASRSTFSSDGVFHEPPEFPAHWPSTSWICVTSTTPATSARRSPTTSASVARIGPDVSTGDAMRIRFARPSASEIRCTSFSARFGQNHGRTVAPSTVTGSPATLPLFSTSRCCQSCSKSCSYAAAIPGEGTRTITFSSRDHESFVQFVEPVQTASPSRTTYLWCIRSGTPGMPRVGSGIDSSSCGSVWGGGGPLPWPG